MNAVAALSTLAMMLMVANAQAEDSAPSMTLHDPRPERLASLESREPVGFHLNRAMDNGQTQPQASEMLTQLAFYAGWPNVFSAVPVLKKVFASRAG